MHSKARLFLGKSVIDGTGRDPILQGGVLEQGGRIVAVKPTASLRRTEMEDVDVIDLGNCTIIPGLIDAHVHHAYYDFSNAYDMELRDSLEMAMLKAAKSSREFLCSGFTSVRDVGGRSSHMAVALRDAIATDILVGPRIRASAQTITSSGGNCDRLPPWVPGLRTSFGFIVNGPEEARRAVREQVRFGVDNIKTEASGTDFNPYSPGEIPTMSYEELAAIVAEAHLKRKTVAVHAEAKEAVINSIRAGVDTVEHGRFIDEEGVELLAKTGRILVPTLSVYTSFAEKGSAAGVPQPIVERHQRAQKHHIEMLREAFQRGVRLAVGTDSGGRFLPHGSNAFELQVLVEKVGLSPMQALVAATKVAAEAIGLGISVGILEAGRYADLVAVDGDPLEDIRILQDSNRLSLIVKEGRILQRDALTWN